MDSVDHMDNMDKFSDVELESLRFDLQQSGLDSWQAAELVSLFLASRGYGVSRQSAQEAVARMESNRCSIACLGYELEKLALMM
jgi:hypothetical protein